MVIKLSVFYCNVTAKVSVYCSGSSKPDCNCLAVAGFRRYTSLWQKSHTVHSLQTKTGGVLGLREPRGCM